MNSSEEQFKCRSIYLLFFFLKPMGKNIILAVWGKLNVCDVFSPIERICLKKAVK